VLTWAITWMIVKTKSRFAEDLVVILFATAILDVAIVYMVVELVAKAVN
jgi:hypothetical protein